VSARIIDHETAIGAAAMLAGVAVLALAYGSGGSASAPGYELEARFNKADGISVGSDVLLAGLSVGKVVAQRLDPNFRAVLTMRVDPSVALPTDSAALIETDGLLGAKFIALQPGADEKNLPPGGEFRFTQDSMNVTDILELIVSQAKAQHAPAPAAK
jgi:phospholipid/cholesterol/gamma-HCH transport system substrate-binding protein